MTEALPASTPTPAGRRTVTSSHRTSARSIAASRPTPFSYMRRASALRARGRGGRWRNIGAPSRAVRCTLHLRWRVSSAWTTCSTRDGCRAWRSAPPRTRDTGERDPAHLLVWLGLVDDGPGSSSPLRCSQSGRHSGCCRRAVGTGGRIAGDRRARSRRTERAAQRDRARRPESRESSDERVCRGRRRASSRAAACPFRPDAVSDTGVRHRGTPSVPGGPAGPIFRRFRSPCRHDRVPLLSRDGDQRAPPATVIPASPALRDPGVGRCRLRCGDEAEQADDAPSAAIRGSLRQPPARSCALYTAAPSQVPQPACTKHASCAERVTRRTDDRPARLETATVPGQRRRDHRCATEPSPVGAGDVVGAVRDARRAERAAVEPAALHAAVRAARDERAACRRRRRAAAGRRPRGLTAHRPQAGRSRARCGRPTSPTRARRRARTRRRGPGTAARSGARARRRGSARSSTATRSASEPSAVQNVVPSRRDVPRRPRHTRAWTIRARSRSTVTTSPRAESVT